MSPPLIVIGVVELWGKNNMEKFKSQIDRGVMGNPKIRESKTIAAGEENS